MRSLKYILSLFMHINRLKNACVIISGICFLYQKYLNTIFSLKPPLLDYPQHTFFTVVFCTAHSTMQVLGFDLSVFDEACGAMDASEPTACMVGDYPYTALNDPVLLMGFNFSDEIVSKTGKVK